MKKFNFKINGNRYEVEIINVENNIAEVDVNGTSYKVEIEGKLKAQKTPTIVTGKVVPSTDVSILKTNKPKEHKGVGLIKAPIPGLIIQVNLKKGDTVKIGDTLMVMEAMKMENNITSDKEGTILSINVNPGDNVLEGDVLAEVGSN
jgi:glutaconyl-CoA/methylmalonyl-CoA decarboxylase subunit gamma